MLEAWWSDWGRPHEDKVTGTRAMAGVHGNPTWCFLEERDGFWFLLLGNIEQLFPIGRELEGAKMD